MKELLEMKLHDQMIILNGQYVITRVPGGWIYDREEPSANISNPVFVPLVKDSLLIGSEFVQ
jgi:hypothetical protein